MKGTRIWVPGEEYDGGLMVVDAKTGERVIVPKGGEPGQLVVPVKPGRFVERPAVRGTIVGRDGDFVVAKIPGDKRVRVLIVAGWQLGSGDGRPPAPDFDFSDRSDREPEAAEPEAAEPEPAGGPS